MKLINIIIYIVRIGEKWLFVSTSVMLVVFVFCVPHVDAMDMPKQIQVADSLLFLNGKATRKKLFFVKIYDIGLYLPRLISDRNQITKDIPQAFAVVIRYKSKKSTGIPKAWREELLPALSPQQKKDLKEALAEAKLGEVFKVEYAPGRGTSIMLEDKILLSETSYELMSVFVDVWLGPKPISKRLARSLLSRK